MVVCAHQKTYFDAHYALRKRKRPLPVLQLPQFWRILLSTNLKSGRKVHIGTILWSSMNTPSTSARLRTAPVFKLNISVGNCFYDSSSKRNKTFNHFLSKSYKGSICRSVAINARNLSSVIHPAQVEASHAIQGTLNRWRHRAATEQTLQKATACS